jgi:hypothetical protein
MSSPTEPSSTPSAPSRAQARHGHLRLRAVAALAIALACAATAGVASAAPAAIERVWSFNGGEVAIQAQPGGGFLGTVVVPTKFAACTHPVGEPMWTSIRAQPDGSYWGSHQWYFETAPCTPNPQPGPTAWRVLKAPSGSSYLLVCFGAPGGRQPTISPAGTPSSVGYGCVRSGEVAPVGAAESFKTAVSLPSARRCLSRRSFQIHLRQPHYDPFKTVSVRLATRALVLHRRGDTYAARVDLRGRPRGAFTVRIAITTVLGHRIAGARTYHTCAPRPGGRAPAKHGG